MAAHGAYFMGQIPLPTLPVCFVYFLPAFCTISAFSVQWIATANAQASRLPSFLPLFDVFTAFHSSKEPKRFYPGKLRSSFSTQSESYFSLLYNVRTISISCVPKQSFDRQILLHKSYFHSQGIGIPGFYIYAFSLVSKKKIDC